MKRRTVWCMHCGVTHTIAGEHKVVVWTCARCKSRMTYTILPDDGAGMPAKLPSGVPDKGKFGKAFPPAKS